MGMLSPGSGAYTCENGHLECLYVHTCIHHTTARDISSAHFSAEPCCSSVTLTHQLPFQGTHTVATH